MPKSNALLFESGRFPLWFRVPAFVFGLLALWFALAIASHGLFGVSLGLPMSGVRGSHFFGSLGCFVIAAAWIFVWFAQLQILFDELRQELVVRTRGYFRSHERRFPLAGSREVHLRHVYSGLVSTTWRITRLSFPMAGVSLSRVFRRAWSHSRSHLRRPRSCQSDDMNWRPNETLDRMTRSAVW